MSLSKGWLRFLDGRLEPSFWFYDPQPLCWWWCVRQHAEFTQHFDHGSIDPRFGTHVVDVAPHQQRRDIDLRLRAAHLIGALPM